MTIMPGFESQRRPAEEDLEQHLATFDLKAEAAKRANTSAEAEAGKAVFAQITEGELDTRLEIAFGDAPLATASDKDIDSAFSLWEGSTSIIEPAPETEMQHEVKMKIFEDAVPKITSLDAMKELVTSMEEIPGNNGHVYTAAEVVSQIELAFNAPALLTLITRKHGLREAIQKLIPLEREREQRDAFTKEERTFFADGEKISSAHTQDKAFAESTPPTHLEMKQVVEKNELSPERRASLEASLQALETQGNMIEHEARLVTIEDKKGKPIDTHFALGLDQLETKLRENYGIDPSAIREGKPLSRWETMRMSFKTLFDSDFRATMQEYEERVAEWMKNREEIHEIRAELADPRGFAERMSKRLLRAFFTRTGASATTSKQKRPLSA